MQCVKAESVESRFCSALAGVCRHCLVFCSHLARFWRCSERCFLLGLVPVASPSACQLSRVVCTHVSSFTFSLQKVGYATIVQECTQDAAFILSQLIIFVSHLKCKQASLLKFSLLIAQVNAVIPFRLIWSEICVVFDIFQI